MRRSSHRAPTREDDAILLFTLQRVCDAVATGEVRELGLDGERILATMRSAITAALAG